MYSGYIRSVHLEKGFLFINSASLHDDVFCHQSEIVDPDLEWDEQLKHRRVVFSTKESPKGVRACNVRAEP